MNCGIVRWVSVSSLKLSDNGMGDRFSALLVSDGFAAHASRTKPLSTLLPFLSQDIHGSCASSEESALPLCSTSVSDYFPALISGYY